MQVQVSFWEKVVFRIQQKLLWFGFDYNKFLRALSGRDIRWYRRDLKEFLKQRGEEDTFQKVSRRPFVDDIKDQAGQARGHYFHQDLYVARLIYQTKPKVHFDIGSRIGGFVAHVAAFREIEVVDIRPVDAPVQNITFHQADMTNLPAKFENCCDSISSLHVIEHIGLGRYGDEINYHGHLEMFDNIHKMLKREGIFYFSVPMGPQRIEFNGHRVFSMTYLLDWVREKFEIQTFSYVNDEGYLIEDAPLNDEDIRNNFNCYFGCGIFSLKKK